MHFDETQLFFFLWGVLSLMAVSLTWTGFLLDRKDWHKGRCRIHGRQWQCYDIDSQGGRLYACDRPLAPNRCNTSIGSSADGPRPYTSTVIISVIEVLVVLVMDSLCWLTISPQPARLPLMSTTSSTSLVAHAEPGLTGSVREATWQSNFCPVSRMTVGSVITVDNFSISTYRCNRDPWQEAVWRQDATGWKCLRYGSRNDVETLVRAGVPKVIAQQLIDRVFQQTN